MVQSLWKNSLAIRQTVKYRAYPDAGILILGTHVSGSEGSASPAPSCLFGW